LQSNWKTAANKSHRLTDHIGLLGAQILKRNLR